MRFTLDYGRCASIVDPAELNLKAKHLMTEALNWNDLADTKLGDVERPPLKPAGHYVALITGRAEQGSSSKKGTLFLKFPINVTEPTSDVDAEELANAGGCPFKSNVTFYITPDAMWRFTEFAKAMGASDDSNILESAEWLAGCGEPFVVSARHEPNEQNPDQPFLRIDNPIAMSDWQSRG